jgi:hypothetical protein
MFTCFGEMDPPPLPFVSGQYDIGHWTLSFCFKEFRIRGKDKAYKEVHNLLCHLLALEVLQLQFRFLCQRPNKKLVNLLCTSEHDSPPFLPHLQSLEFDLEFYFPWIFIPRALNVKVDHICHLCIADKTVQRLLELVVQEGFPRWWGFTPRKPRGL